MKPRSPLLERGSIIYLDFSPRAGHEQASRRPALVVSPSAYNVKVGLALVCPITSQVKGYPFEVAIPKGQRVQGVVLADQVKSVDWRARDADIVGQLSPSLIDEVLARLRALL